jgi:hypothetical protein
MRLPYKTAPKPPSKTIGAPDIGELEFPMYYGLTANEKKYLEDHSKSLPDTQAEMVKLAKKIAEAIEGDYVEIANQLVNLSRHPDLNKVVQGQFEKEYKKLREDYDKRTKGDRENYVSAMMIYRLGISDWQPELIYNVDEIRSPLVDLIYGFALDEEAGLRDPEEAQALTAEQLGKSSGESTEPPSTGNGSSGSVKDSGPQTPDSVPAALAASPSG